MEWYCMECSSAYFRKYIIQWRIDSHINYKLLVLELSTILWIIHYRSSEVKLPPNGYHNLKIFSGSKIITASLIDSETS